MLPSLSLSSSASSASVMVDKATSDFLMAPDWTLNMEICDSANSDHGMTKEVIKAVKKRLQHKNPRVQMLTLTLLETLVKNCGDHIHFHIAERKVLDEMIKIVKKRTDLQVRDKILVLLDSWQEAFGGSGGKHGQYYWAYDELRRSGIHFPRRSLATVPIITPPAALTSTGNPQSTLGLPSNSTTTLDEAMASDGEGLSVSGMETIRNAMELFADMLQAVNPNDRMSVKDEVIVDLVDRCRTNQKRLVQMLGTTMDEELLGQGLELNDSLQVLLAKHDAIASGSPLPPQLTSTVSSRPYESSTSNLNLKPSGSGSRPEDSSSSANAKPFIPSGEAMKGRVVDEEEEEDEFALLARRHSRASPVPMKSEDAVSSSTSNGPTLSASTILESSFSNALVPVDPPSPVKITKEQDMVDFLSIVLSTSLTPEEEPKPQTPIQASAQDYSGNNAQPAFHSYVVPWAQSQPQPQQQSQFQTHQLQPPQQTSAQPSYPQQSSAYPPPPWAPTPGYATSRTTMTPQYTNPMQEDTKNVSTPMQGFQPYPYQNQQPANTGIRTLQQSTSFQHPQSANQLGSSPLQPTLNSSATVMGAQLSRGGSGGVTDGAAASSSPRGQQKSYVPSYKLFEDLNVFGNIEGKMRSGPYSSASGSSNQSVVGGRR